MKESKHDLDPMFRTGRSTASSGLIYSQAPNGKSVLIPLLSNFTAATDGTGTASYSDIEIGDAEGLFAFAESVTAHTLTRGASAQHDWKIVFYYSFDGKSWSSPIDLFPWISAGTGYAIQTANTTTSNFGLRVRFALAVRNSAGTVVNTAIVSCVLKVALAS
ncbi:hypothetical protein L6R50_27225 [Myxococcota bacterium]|nr:hypothetical protein [Myxococcota bacterium]